MQIFRDSTAPRRARCAALACAALCTAGGPRIARAGDDPISVVVVAKDQDPAARMLHHALAGAVARSPEYRLVYATRPSAKHARAQKQLHQAQALQQSARTLFDSLELDAAVRDYSKALQRFDKHIAWEADLSPLVEGLSMLAAAHLLLGGEKRARAYLERLLILRPNFRPDEALFNPTMLEVFGSQLRATAKLNKVQFTVASDPSGAAVYVNGTFAGLAPTTVAHPRGRHFIRVEAAGYETGAKTLDVKKDAQGIHFDLARSPSAETTARLMNDAVDGASQPVMGDAALDLADLAGAKEIALISAGTPNRLIRYRRGGSERLETSAVGNPKDAASATSLVVKLLDESTARSTPFVAAASDETNDKEDGDGDNSGNDAVVTHATRTNAGGSKIVVVMSTYGAAAVLGVAGGVFGLLALQDQKNYDKITVINDELDHSNTTDQIEGKAFADGGSRKAMIADVMYGAAIVAGITGVLLHILWEPGPSQASASPDWGVGPGWFAVRF